MGGCLSEDRERESEGFAIEVMVEESDEEPPGQRRMLLPLLLLGGLQAATAQVDGVPGEALYHKMKDMLLNNYR